MNKWLPCLCLLLLVLCPVWASGPADTGPSELKIIEQIVRDSIGWALTKDRPLLESIIAHDEDYFSFHPEGLTPVHGYEEFLHGFDIWMDERFKATRFEVRDFRAHISRSGDVAWFSAILDDCFEWDGRPGCWSDTRWTGVLEKQSGKWVIMQMHFSFAADQVTAEAADADTDPPELRGPYFGQQPPGETAVLFAADLISVTGRYEYAVSFAPAGDRLLFTAQVPEEDTRLLESRMLDGRWTRPEPVSLSGGERPEEMEAFFTPDGKQVYFAPYEEGMDVRIWRVDVEGDQWLNPAPLPSPVADAPAFFPTCSKQGNLLYTNLAARKIFRARQSDSGSWETSDAGLQFGSHAFIAPDESFVLLDARAEDSLGKADIYVAFARPDWGWTRPVNLGPAVNTAAGETCPTLSHDGKYLFFSRYNEEGDVSNIYWVDSAVILKASELK